MGKKHDENKDIRLVSRIAKIDYSNKTIQANKYAIIGNKTCGSIDFLTLHCGWSFFWNNSVIVAAKLATNEDGVKHKRDAKQDAKVKMLTNKKKRKS